MNWHDVEQLRSDVSRHRDRLSMLTEELSQERAARKRAEVELEEIKERVRQVEGIQQGRVACTECHGFFMDQNDYQLHQCPEDKGR